MGPFGAKHFLCQGLETVSMWAMGEEVQVGVGSLVRQYVHSSGAVRDLFYPEVKLAEDSDAKASARTARQSFRQRRMAGAVPGPSIAEHMSPRQGAEGMD